MEPGPTRNDPRIQDQPTQQPLVMVQLPSVRPDRLSAEDRAPARRVIERCVELYVAGVAGALLGMLTVGPVLGVLFALTVLFVPWSDVDPCSAFSTGMFAGWVGTALVSALIAWFDRF
jgi:hypothetical protein